jgi:LysR family transcriptional regulator, positive regulator for ilvC
MDFYELEAFNALAKYLHFAKAAQSLHTSPSALSRLVTRLEDELGSRLFERDTRRVALTEDGESFLAFARDSLHRREDLRLRIGKRDDKLRGILRVYASVTACYTILPPLVALLSAEQPELRLSVHTGDPALAEEAVRDGRAELGLTALPEGGYSDLDCFSVRRTPLVYAARAEGPYGSLALAKEGAREIESMERALAETLPGLPLILPAAGLARERFDHWTRERGIKARVAAETEGNEAVLALAHLGLGLGLAPRLVLESGPFAQGLVLYGAALGDYDIGFVQRSGNLNGEAERRQQAITDILNRAYRA